MLPALLQAAEHRGRGGGGRGGGGGGTIDKKQLKALILSPSCAPDHPHLLDDCQGYLLHW